MGWASGSCLLVRALEVFGVGELRVLVSRFGMVLVLVGLVERVFKVLFYLFPRDDDDGKKTRVRNDGIEDYVTAAKRERSEEEGKRERK
jgi:hypothetical protein